MAHRHDSDRHDPHRYLGCADYDQTAGGGKEREVGDGADGEVVLVSEPGVGLGKEEGGEGRGGNGGEGMEGRMDGGGEEN